MTKRWSSTRSDLTKTKRQASKEARVGKFLVDYDELPLSELLKADPEWDELLANSSEINPKTK